MSEKIVTLATFGSVEEAYLAKNFLENEGIRACLADESSVGNLWYLGNAMGGVKLLIADSDLARAERVLDRHGETFHESSAELTENPPHRPKDETGITADKLIAPDPVETSNEVDSPEDEEDEDQATADEPESPFTLSGEVMATRAFRAAVFNLIFAPGCVFSSHGLIFVPLAFYSFWILFNVLGWEGELSRGAHVKIFLALIINGFVLLFLVLVWFRT